jgi:sugar phosphate isomerase/epimerase
MFLAMRESMAPGATLSERLAALERMEYGGIEPLASASLPVSELVAAFRASKIRPCVIGGSRLLFELERSKRLEGLAEMRKAIDLAAAIGSPGVLIAAYLPPVWPDLSPVATGPQLQRQALVAQLQELAPQAERQAVQFVLEPLNRYESPVIQSLADGVELCRQIGSPAAKIMADFFHMQLEEDDIAASIRAAAGYIVHVHVAGSSRKQPGIGHLDFRPGFRALKEASYAGPISLECRVVGPPEEALKASGAFVRAEWEAA